MSKTLFEAIIASSPNHFDTPGDSEYITYYTKDRNGNYNTKHEVNQYSIHTNVFPVNEPFTISKYCDLIKFTILIPSCSHENNNDLISSFTVPIVDLNVDEEMYKILQLNEQMKSYVKKINYNEYHTVIPVYHGFKNPIVLEKDTEDREYIFKMNSQLSTSIGILIQTHEYTLYNSDLRYFNSIALYTEIYSRVLNRKVKSNEQVSLDIQDPFVKCLYFIANTSIIKSVYFLPQSSNNNRGGRYIDGKLLNVKGNVYRLPFCDRPEIFKYTGSINLASGFEDTKLTFEFEKEETFLEIYVCRSNYIFGPKYKHLRYY
jgi:hypothetical protein